MAGDTEYRLSARDSFWTWRQSMYSLANRLSPTSCKSSPPSFMWRCSKRATPPWPNFITCTGGRDGSHYTGANPLWEAVHAAAETTGIGLTFLPTLYQTGDFGGQPLKPEQARFQYDTDAFLARRRIAGARGPTRRPTSRNVPAWLSTACARCRCRNCSAPPHACSTSTPACRCTSTSPSSCSKSKAACAKPRDRPIELLLQTGLVDPHWCLVHATHATPPEIKSIADSGAQCACPSAPRRTWATAFSMPSATCTMAADCASGSDSQSTVNPAEELRWLEYQQRLRKKRRGVLATRTRITCRHASVARRSARRGTGPGPAGGRAGRSAVARIGWCSMPRIRAGGRRRRHGFGSLVFAGGDKAIRDVMVAGRWVVRGRAPCGRRCSAAALRHNAGRTGQTSFGWRHSWSLARIPPWLTIPVYTG